MRTIPFTPNANPNSCPLNLAFFSQNVLQKRPLLKSIKFFFILSGFLGAFFPLSCPAFDSDSETSDDLPLNSNPPIVSPLDLKTLRSQRAEVSPGGESAFAFQPHTPQTTREQDIRFNFSYRPDESIRNLGRVIVEFHGGDHGTDSIGWFIFDVSRTTKDKPFTRTKEIPRRIWERSQWISLSPCMSEVSFSHNTAEHLKKSPWIDQSTVDRPRGRINITTKLKPWQEIERLEIVTPAQIQEGIPAAFNVDVDWTQAEDSCKGMTIVDLTRVENTLFFEFMSAISVTAEYPE